MKQSSYQTIFSKLTQPEAPTTLKMDIAKHIAHFESTVRTVRMWGYATISFFSFIFLVGATILLYRNMLTSDFWTLLSLGISDFSTLRIYWQDFALSLLETAPTFAILLALSSLLSGGLSTARLLEETRKAKSVASFSYMP